MVDKAKETKRKILLAAIEEFAVNGYMSGNLDNVVVRADVSKGLIFHYFTNKMNLYKECVIFSLETFKQQIMDLECMKEKDIFDRLLKVARARLRLVKENYYMNMLIESTSSLPQIDKYKDVYDIFKQFGSFIQGIFLKDLDFSMFKDPSDKELIMHFMMMFMQYHNMQLLKNIRKGIKTPLCTCECSSQSVSEDQMIKHAEEAFFKIEKLMHILKYGLYKTETNIKQE